ncbi:L-threonylcarbamoyladenylate synthase [Brevibacillus dissolubilis]|uniref:L-threonylcarbamoyladenylate synthase n=1 Tax=Brevibacillus dissolubilis TaxID=1844116 RepID=UPI001115B1A4|nr:L-threonylcarbamoyladenylate synthase [Brevibacillus dissolubilis]
MQKKYETQVFHVDKNVEHLESCTQIVDSAKFVEAGELVAFPTETVYGLGANACSADAVEKIFVAKGRPSDNPLIVHIGDMSQLSQVASEVSPAARRLMDAFWPGPLTLFLPKQESVPDRVTAGLPTVGVRMPAHPVALALINVAGVPIAAPSANRSGRPSPTTAAHVAEDLDGRIAAILDGGSTGVGVESTTIDMTVEPPMIHRPGGITYEQIQAVIGDVAMDPAHLREKDAAPVSPGMKYAHYAPEGEMWLVEGDGASVRAKMIELLHQAKAQGLSTGVMTTEESLAFWKDSADADVALACGSVSDMTSVARDLYGVLRQFDEQRVQFIVAETFPREGLGLAVMNRLEKAAAHRIISV